MDVNQTRGIYNQTLDIFAIYTTIESLWCTSETNIVCQLYLNLNPPNFKNKNQKTFLKFIWTCKRYRTPQTVWKKKDKNSQTKIGRLKLKYLAMPGVGKDMEQWELSYIPDRM